MANVARLSPQFPAQVKASDHGRTRCRHGSPRSRPRSAATGAQPLAPGPRGRRRRGEAGGPPPARPGGRPRAPPAAGSRGPSARERAATRRPLRLLRPHPGSRAPHGTPGPRRTSSARPGPASDQRLGTLHAWTPSDEVGKVLADVPDHGGFAGRQALIAQIDKLEIPEKLLDGLKEIAARAPLHTRAAVPVHADCHWDN